MDNQLPPQPKILLIEDDTFIREMLHDEMVRFGMNVQSFEKGNDAITALASNKFDLVLLDIMLPDTNGLQILRQIKSNPQTKDTKVVMLTNLGNDDLVKEGHQLGAIGYLVKAAYNPEQIITEVKRFLSASPTPQQPALT